MQVGESQSRGFEWEVSGHIRENWNLAAGYAYSDAKVTADINPLAIGARLPHAARHSAHIWTRYNVISGPLDGLGIGGGIIYVGDRVSTLPSSPDSPIFRLPGYHSLDLALYYSHGDYDFSMKVANLLDDEYFIAAQSAVEVQPGSPRSVSFTLKKNF